MQKKLKTRKIGLKRILGNINVKSLEDKLSKTLDKIIVTAKIEATPEEVNSEHYKLEQIITKIKEIVDLISSLKTKSIYSFLQEKKYMATVLESIIRFKQKVNDVFDVRTVKTASKDNKNEAKVIEFIKKNPEFSDAQMSDWCAKNGLSESEVRAIIYEFASKYISFSEYGRSKEEDFTSKDMPKQELKDGKEIEKEHTINPEIAEKITLDHGAESERYYKGLKFIERLLDKYSEIEDKDFDELLKKIENIKL